MQESYEGIMDQYLAISARGIENLLAGELENLGALDVRPAVAGVRFKADLETAYKCCLWSRLASRFILVLNEFRASNDGELYKGALAIDWPEYFEQRTKIIVDFNGTNREIRNSKYGALKVKDAIVDRFLKAGLAKPDVDLEYFDLRVHMRLSGVKGVLGLDMVGSGLHQRGYRSEAGKAPLRETHAAALVLKSGFKPGNQLLDPMCGSGTILIEAAMMAAQIAPGLKRSDWGFQYFKDYKAETWEKLIDQAQNLAKEGSKNIKPIIFGSDIKSTLIRVAQKNARNAGVSAMIRFKQGDAKTLKRPEGFEKGIIICNPPYGERMGATEGLFTLHREFGKCLKTDFGGSTASIYSSEDELLSCLGMRAEKRYQLNNGALECVLKTYEISDGFSADKTTKKEAKPLAFAAPEFANRLKKNLAKISKWAKKENIHCFRIYDADLPNYNAAIDLYNDYAVIQEYAAPKSVPLDLARRRLKDIKNATIQVTGISPNKVILKVRERQKGKKQYQKLSQKERYILVKELEATLKVNLFDYLDTGLFLDHRPTRKMLGEMAKGKDFLNLFAYTGTATVHAALGGAKSTLTIDMSKTYIAWAQENMQLNNKTGPQHQFEQTDCLQWLESPQKSYDLIFIDPPTFSNSKRMEQNFDIQRDHIDLLKKLKPLLRPKGEIVFSNNKRNFKMDLENLEGIGLKAKNISDKTLPFDFSRNKQIHNCWLLTHQD